MVCKIINLPKNYGRACEYIPNNELQQLFQINNQSIQQYFSITYKL